MECKVIANILVSVIGLWVLSIVLLVSSELVNGMVVGQQVWFHYAAMAFAGSVLLTWIMQKKKIAIAFTLPDLLVLALSGLLLFTKKDKKILLHSLFFSKLIKTHYLSYIKRIY